MIIPPSLLRVGEEFIDQSWKTMCFSAEHQEKSLKTQNGPILLKVLIDTDKTVKIL